MQFTKFSLPNAVYQIKFTKFSLPNAVYQTKFTKLSLPNLVSQGTKSCGWMNQVY